MGCIVNGPGEASHADIGLAGGKNKFILFKKGVPYLTIDEDEAIFSKEIRWLAFCCTLLASSII